MSLERGEIPDEERIVVTGMGVVSPLGHEVEGAMDALFAGESGIDTVPLDIAIDYTQLGVHVAANVRGFDAESDPLLTQVVKPKEWPRIHRAAQFGLWATGRALRQAGVVDLDNPRLSPDGDLNPHRVAVVMGTGVGGANMVGDAQLRMEAGRLPEPSGIFNVLPERTSTVISMAFGTRGPARTVSAACATGNAAMATAADLLRAGRTDLVITGGTEAQVTGTSLGLFRVIKALDRSEDPDEASRPFHRDARGFVMGEGAGAFVMETLASARRRGAVPVAELIGYAETSDAFHNTQPLGTGDALELALLEAGILDGTSVRAAINAHGTGTGGDAIELRGIRKGLADLPFELTTVGVSSVKGAIGHTLGAASAIEGIASIETLWRNTVPPTLKLDDPVPETEGFNMSPHTATPVPEGIDIVVNESFGFGGPNAVTVFARPPQD